jgi:uncharacterized membrane protein
VAKFHLILNLSVLPFIAVSIWLRYEEVPPAYHLLPVVISLLAVLLVSISGWLGGELVSRYRISVHEQGES